MRSLVYIVVMAVLVCCGCSRPQPREFDEAERLMQTDPSAALARLNSVDVSELEDSAAMARWALLYSEALVVNKLSAPTDTIVDIAIGYYGRHNQTDELRRASRLKAIIKATDNVDPLATALYLQKEKEFLLYKERAKRNLYALIGGILLFIAAGIIVWLRQRLRIQSLENENLIAEASAFKCDLESSRGDVSRLETKLRGLLDNRFSLIDSLCQTYYESQGTKSERKAIADKVKSEIEAVRTDSFPEMERAVNDCRDNILVKIKEADPGMKQADYMLLVYLASGLSSRAISLLLGETVEVVYKRKSRLKARLSTAVGAIVPELQAIF